MKKFILVIAVMVFAIGSIITRASEQNVSSNYSAYLTAKNPSLIEKASLPERLIAEANGNNGQDNIALDIPLNDECIDAEQINSPFPANVYGTTIDATIDCPDGFGEAAVWYKFDVNSAWNEVTIDYCLTENDQIDYSASLLYADCPSGGIECADYIEAYQYYETYCSNGYTNAQVRWLGLPGPATYYFPVYFNVASDFGFTIDITEYTQAVVTCPGGAQMETEACGDDDNSGCLMPSGYEQFESIDCDTDICGTYWSNFHTRDMDWYEIILTTRGFINWSAVGEAPTRIWIYNGTGGCDGIFLGSDAAEPGLTANLELELEAGTYWLVVGVDGWFDMPCDGSGMFTNDYIANATCEPGIPVFSVTPTVVYGEALEGFTDTEILTVSNIGTGRLNFIAEATQNVTVVLSDNRGSQHAIDNNSVDIHSLLSPYAPENIEALYQNMPVSTDDIFEPDEIIMSLDCPIDGIAEAEACGDDINGGCAMFPGSEAFETVDCNTILCGTSWSDGSTRDTDWFTLTLTESTLLYYSITADFPLLTFIIKPGSPGDECDDFQALYFASAVAGDTTSIISSLPPGTYWIWVGPAAWYNQPCDGTGDFGNDYVAWINCEPPWLTIDILSGTIHEGDPDIDIEVLMDATDLEPGTYTGMVTFYSNDQTNSPFEVPVTFVVDEVYGYLPGDANMGTGIWPAEVSGADVVYLVNYFYEGQSDPCLYGTFWASADANGDCIIMGSDVIYLVRYFRGGNSGPLYCPYYPCIPPIEETYPDCIPTPAISDEIIEQTGEVGMH